MQYLLQCQSRQIFLTDEVLYYDKKIPLSNNFYACSSKAPAKTTIPVVPSPTSLSWLFDSSTNNLATGCWIYIFSTIVAPSFVTVTSWSGETRSLSRPLGPNEDLRVLATDLAASMFLYIKKRDTLMASIPLILLFESCSFRTMKGRPYSSKAKLIDIFKSI